MVDELGDFEGECHLLALNDSVDSRTKLYLRLLYSARAANIVRALVTRADETKIPYLTRAMLGTVNYDLLSLEQAARSRNLTRHLLRAMAPLRDIISEGELADLISRFVNSTAFWRSRGRSLAENFCLFAAEIVGRRAFQHDVLRLCSVVSGLAVEPNSLSPWTEHEYSRPGGLLDGAVACETFISDWRLVDAGGGLPSKDNQSETAIAGSHRIIVGCYPDGRVVALSIVL